MRQTVDILTLTATPIPRTLYMSLTGARDMSTIQTPPQARLPIETIVAENRDEVIREAVLRELNRDGQVFYLHNRAFFNEEGDEASDGPGDIAIFTKYRFWRQDSLGLQQSAAVLLKVITGTGDEDENPSLGTGTTDAILGLTYGYEGRKWYRWASLRYRFNEKNDAGVERGDKILFDLVGGYRPTLTSYREPDTVWLLELNGEYGHKAELDGATLDKTGGTELFLSPGIVWTRLNCAVKAGVQIPVYSNLNGVQDDTDYRARATIEWHL
jgi:hypothetical protein